MSKLSALKHNLIGDRPFYKQMLSILIPVIIQNTVTNVVSLVDNVMVGRVGTLQMSAVAIVNQLLFVFYLAVFGGLSGAGIFTAQYHGAKDKKGIQHTVRFKYFISLIIIAVSFIIFSAFNTELIGIYLTKGTSAADATETLIHGREYLKIMLWGIVPFAISQVYMTTLREVGETKLPMVAGVTAILVNVAFNYILIFGNEGLAFLPFAPLGVAGAATATVLSRYVELAVVFIAVHKNPTKYTFVKGLYQSFRIPLKLCREIFYKGAPLMVNEILWSMGMAAIMQCYSTRGIEVVAATNISNTVCNLFNVVYFSMGTAIAIIVGQQLGAGKTQEAKTTVWRLLAFSVATCAVMGALLFGVSFLVPYAYNTTALVRQLATKLLWIVCLYMPFNAFTHGCYFAMRSGGKTFITLVFDSGFIWCLSYPLGLVLAEYTALSILSLYLLVQGLEVLKSIAAFILIKKGVWVNNIVSNN